MWQHLCMCSLAVFGKQWLAHFLKKGSTAHPEVTSAAQKAKRYRTEKDTSVDISDRQQGLPIRDMETCCCPGFNPSIDSRQLNFSPHMLSLLTMAALDQNDNYGYEDVSLFGQLLFYPEVKFSLVCRMRQPKGFTSRWRSGFFARGRVLSLVSQENQY